MLNPEMRKMMRTVGNRYLLVNLAAQRARDIAERAQEQELTLAEKPVRMAMDEIAEGVIEPEAELVINRTETGEVF